MNCILYVLILNFLMEKIYKLNLTRSWFHPQGSSLISIQLDEMINCISLYFCTQQSAIL